MASEKDLIELLQGSLPWEKTVWIPRDLCNALGVDVIQAVNLIEKARKLGVDVRVVSGDKTGETGKVFLGGDHV